MKVAFITRATLYKVPGGDTIQILETAKHLQELGIEVHIFLSHEKINYNQFDLLHFFNLTRPADILYHVKKTKTPYVVSPILVDYSEYDKNHRQGFPGWILRRFRSHEYIKTISRWILLKDRLRSKQYLWQGHQKAIQEILKKARMVLPNSNMELEGLAKCYSLSCSHAVIPNGINEQIFHPGDCVQKDEKLVVCAARIEGIKNQVNLVKALSHTAFTLVLVGEPGPNHKNYYRQCRRMAGQNIVFAGRLSQEQTANYFKKAKVHVLPSWFETCGLSSLEAAASGCNVVVTNKGFTREYFGDSAFYCDPGNTESIYDTIKSAAASKVSNELSQKILKEFTWAQAAKKTLNAYKTCLNN